MGKNVIVEPFTQTETETGETLAAWKYDQHDSRESEEDESMDERVIRQQMREANRQGYDFIVRAVKNNKSGKAVAVTAEFVSGVLELKEP